MGNVLKKYQSRSNPAKSYDIMEPNGGGVPYCTCPGWKFSKDIPKTCKHLQDYLSEQPSVVEYEPIDTHDASAPDDIQSTIDDVLAGNQ